MKNKQARIALLFTIIITTFLGATIGVQMTADTKSTDHDSREIRFTSGAIAQVPEGSSAKSIDHGYQINIEGDDLKIHFFEVAKPIEASLDQIEKQIFSRRSLKAIQTLKPEEVEWDHVRIIAYSDKASTSGMVQLLAKEKEGTTWILALDGDEAAFERRFGAAMTLFTSLKVPGQVELSFDLEEMKSLKGRTESLDQFVVEAMKKLQIPGLSLAVIEKGKVVHIKGFGLNRLNDSSKVKTDTRFMIGSVSKSLTTFLLAKLDEDKSLSWNDKAEDLDSKFQLKDKVLTSRLRLVDLVCACSGIPRREIPLILNSSGKTAEDLMGDLGYLEATTSIGESYQYSNQIVAAAGYIAANKMMPSKSRREGYQALMQKHVFGPMNMKNSIIGNDQVVAEGNFAFPHRKHLDGSLDEMDLNFEKFAELSAPSGGIWSSIEDMAEYVITEIQMGKNSEGKRVLQEGGILFRRKKQIQMTQDMHYGLGWYVGKHLGLDVVMHGGATLGYSSGLVILPKLNSGFAILSNTVNGVHMALFTKVIELWFDRDLKSEKSLDSSVTLEKQISQGFASRLYDLPENDQKRYVGTHVNQEVGPITFEQGEGSLYVKLNNARLKVTGHNDPSGKKNLVIVDVPLAGVTIDPVFKDGYTIKLGRGQEEFLFTISSPNGGIDTGSINKSILPGNDFYQFANGNWESSQKIPKDRPSSGSFHRVHEKLQSELKRICDGLLSKKAEGLSKDEALVRSLYESFLDEKSIEKLGFQPILPLLTKISGAKKLSDWFENVISSMELGVSVPISMVVAPNRMNSKEYRLLLQQDGLGLPAKTFYSNPELLKHYEAYLTQVLTTINQRNPGKQAAKVIAFEKKLAGIHWDIADLRDQKKTVNPMRPWMN